MPALSAVKTNRWKLRKRTAPSVKRGAAWPPGRAVLSGGDDDDGVFKGLVKRKRYRYGAAGVLHGFFNDA